MPPTTKSFLLGSCISQSTGEHIIRPFDELVGENPLYDLNFILNDLEISKIITGASEGLRSDVDVNLEKFRIREEIKYKYKLKIKELEVQREIELRKIDAAV